VGGDESIPTNKLHAETKTDGVSFHRTVVSKRTEEWHSREFSKLASTAHQHISSVASQNDELANIRAGGYDDRGLRHT
jgi:hypothetical protein